MLMDSVMMLEIDPLISVCDDHKSSTELIPFVIIIHQSKLRILSLQSYVYSIKKLRDDGVIGAGITLNKV